MDSNLTRFFKKIAGFSLILALLLISARAQATHIRAAEITIERISTTSLSYRFTVTAIRDSEGNVQFGLGDFDFGDGRVLENIKNLADSDARDADGDLLIKSFDIEFLEDNLELIVFVVEHTYSSAAPSYLVSYRELNRNEGILNIGNSVNTAFYVESQLRIDPIIGINNSPVTTVLPIDKGGQFVAFFHNPGAFDPDGDSLSYKLTTPQRARGVNVNGYLDPNSALFYSNFNAGNEAQTGTPTFTLDPVTGTLEWDAPGTPGEYNVAFIIEEWREIGGEWFRLGFITRDMQIIIEETDNERPEVIVPEDICVEAGTLVEGIFQGTDPDGHPILIEAFGGPFELSPRAQITPNSFQNNQPAVSTFSWQTTCSHVRERPYEVVVKISDRPPVGPTLVSFETWRITVVGPAPTGVQADKINSREINVTWDQYSCPQADSIEVWRRVDSFDFEVDDCELGMPPSAGYDLIDVVSARNTDYRDDNDGIGLAAGATYCYRLVARFPRPGGGISYVSEEACDSLEAVRPVITNVDVESTSTEDGEIIVKWLPPFDLDVNVVPEPYEYEIFRTAAGSAPVSLGTTADLTITDGGLNTTELIYTYEVLMRDANGLAIDTSASASSVRLEPTPLFRAIELNWSANVPWSIRSQDHPYHLIYRDNVNGSGSELVFIDSVNVNTNNLFYVDDGSFNDTPLNENTEYCYYVETRGVYGNENINEPLINRSQIICSRPNDLIPPCTPLGFSFDPDFDCEQQVADKLCSFNNFVNHLVWEEDTRAGCDDDIVAYNVYFSLEEAEVFEDLELIATVSTTEFFHENLSSLKGCYSIRAVDRSGNLSPPTAIVCNDNCPNYEFPNTFSPNGDGQNDFFTPFYETLSRPIDGFNRRQCPRFVRKVVFRVFDRTGNQLYVYNSDDDLENNILINWNGTSTSGNALPTGTYFYTADVTFDVLRPEDSVQQFKGWIQLFR